LWFEQLLRLDLLLLLRAAAEQSCQQLEELGTGHLLQLTI
jgi:hypothetical protein